MRNLFILAAGLLLAGPALAQPADYWQQRVDYSIHVTLDDRRHELRGQEEITYQNNSRTALPYIWFHLWPNAYRDNTTAFARQQLRNDSRRFHFAPPADRGFIDSLQFRVNGLPAKLEFDPHNPDMARLLLPVPLPPGGGVSISTPFRVKIPASFSRLGHVGQSYQISQWYPKPAVFDQRGWHPMPYLDQGEFYSEFGSFDVTISLPANYTVGATGQLQNPDEQARLARLAAADAGKKTDADFTGVPAATGGNADRNRAEQALARTFPPSATSTKTLRYRQDRIHDFAWFADKRFHVLQDSVALPSGRRVLAQVMFTNQEPAKWVKGLQDVKDALVHYSRWVGEYPYASATAVDGALAAGGGMEYPMVTVTQPGAIVHEVGHNWFYGILGSNERDFPWLDEGVNSSVEARVAEQTGGEAGILGGLGKSARLSRLLGIENLPTAAVDQLAYQALASRALDQPVQGPTSAEYTSLNYGVTVYQKTASLLKYLAGYLGQPAYDRAMHEYFRRWQFRHPYPEDMQAAFEESTGQPLGWFFKGMLMSTAHYDADLSAKLVYQDTVKVLVRTTSPTPWAIPVSTVDAQGQILETQWTRPLGNPDPDAEDEPSYQLNFRRPNAAAVVVDAGYLTPELHRRDDRLGIDERAPRLEPLRLRPLLSVERWDRATINWLPVLGANTSDKFMLGAAFYNNVLAPRRIQYLAMPMYSFSRNELNGLADLRFHVLPAGLARQITTGVLVQRFERYFKVEPSLTFALPRRVQAGPRHLVKLALAGIYDQDVRRTRNIQTAEYEVAGGNALQQWSASVELNRLIDDDEVFDFGEATLLRASASYLRFYSPRKRVRARLFGGRFLQEADQSAFFLGLSGSPDYRRQTPFLDRQQVSNTFTAQTHQTDDRDGAFKGFLPVYDNKWLATLNLQADLPVTPLGVFADFGATHGRYITSEAANPTARRVFYDAGVVVPLLRDVFQFYLPVAGSQYVGGLPDDFHDFSSRIRFVLNLTSLSPFRQLDRQLAK